MQEATQTKLTREQKQAVGLLSIGTFLEYFDLMLYVHMAVLLNELFFPKYDPFTASLISAAAFCSSYMLRPFGAIIFGYIGDNIGRKHTVIITTFLMSFSCLIMANLPTYAQIGITASWIITICRMLQGVSSMGEAVGAELYLSEMIKPPLRYSSVALIVVAGTLGATISLAVASCVTSFGFNWRIAFWFGAGIALIGSIARTTLRETTEFINAKKRVNSTLKQSGISSKLINQKFFSKSKVKKITIIAYFFIECTGPLWFCITYIYCANILKNSFGFTPEEIIHQNFLVAFVELLGTMVLTIIVIKMHPIKVLTIKLYISAIFLILIPVLLNNISNYYELLFLQLFIVVFAPTGFPAFSVFCMNFPVYKRFMCTSLIFAISRALMYAICSFGIVFATHYYNHWGLLIIIMPVIIGYALGLFYFRKLEESAGNYY
tara:strand:- start:338 stop:1642 length:1305 start_codon:yes stop_codon:yes gene_type:complete